MTPTPNPTLHPAQAFFLIKPRKSTLEDIYKYIIWDLFARSILKVELKKRKVHKRDRYNKAGWYVSIGPAFEGYEPASFEKYILKKFTKNPRKIIHYSLWARNLFDKTPKSGKFKRKFLKPSEPLKDLVAFDILTKNIAVHSLNEKGALQAKQLKTYLKEFEARVDNGHFRTHPAEFMDHFLVLKGNALLLSSTAFQHFTVFRKKYRAIPKNMAKDPICKLYNPFYLSEEFDHFWDNFHYFDEGFERHFGPINTGTSQYNIKDGPSVMGY